ncbi:wiskott-Aldrich syndrome protein homolog 1-like [Triticum dicoccoides]|uniref:wiskott-Aldrich syndrome protein homolog 1-like n=1 Tax=Triticum dicoccoides TaxID=85692 RepID=UPI0018916A3B|nr:wiskott-Aldrich syndrome protein homolog 1-like [Triticum dicoccoides]
MGELMGALIKYTESDSTKDLVSDDEKSSKGKKNGNNKGQQQNMTGLNQGNGGKRKQSDGGLDFVANTNTQRNNQRHKGPCSIHPSPPPLHQLPPRDSHRSNQRPSPNPISPTASCVFCATQIPAAPSCSKPRPHPSEQLIHKLFCHAPPPSSASLALTFLAACARHGRRFHPKISKRCRLSQDGHGSSSRSTTPRPPFVLVAALRNLTGERRVPSPSRLLPRRPDTASPSRTPLASPFLYCTKRTTHPASARSSQPRPSEARRHGASPVSPPLRPRPPATLPSSSPRSSSVSQGLHPPRPSTESTMSGSSHLPQASPSLAGAPSLPC